MTPLPLPPAEVPVQRSLDVLAPKFRAAVDAILRDLAAEGWQPRVAETLRTQERQNFLHGFGREYDDGRGRVTNSQDADESWHGYGLAVDIVNNPQGWSAPPKFWAALGAAAKKHGCRWGGDWNENGRADEKFRDVPHVQWGLCRVSPSPRAGRLLAMGGVTAVWSEVGAL